MKIAIMERTIRSSPRKPGCLENSSNTPDLVNSEGHCVPEVLLSGDHAAIARMASRTNRDSNKARRQRSAGNPRRPEPAGSRNSLTHPSSTTTAENEYDVMSSNAIHGMVTKAKRKKQTPRNLIYRRTRRTSTPRSSKGSKNASRSSVRGDRTFGLTVRRNVNGPAASSRAKASERKFPAANSPRIRQDRSQTQWQSPPCQIVLPPRSCWQDVSPEERRRV